MPQTFYIHLCRVCSAKYCGEMRRVKFAAFCLCMPSALLSSSSFAAASPLTNTSERMLVFCAFALLFSDLGDVQFFIYHIFVAVNASLLLGLCHEPDRFLYE